MKKILKIKEEKGHLVLKLKEFNKQDTVIKKRLILYAINKTIGNVQNIENIIVLLILAGIAIVALTGDNGLLVRAKQAKNNTLEAQNAENATLGDYENTINGILNGATRENATKINYIDKIVATKNETSNYQSVSNSKELEKGKYFITIVQTSRNDNGAGNYTGTTNSWGTLTGCDDCNLLLFSRYGSGHDGRGYEHHAGNGGQYHSPGPLSARAGFL